MRHAPGLALLAATMVVTAGPTAADTAAQDLVLDIAMETRDLAFKSMSLVFHVENLIAAVQTLETAESGLELQESDLRVKESVTEIRIEVAGDVLFDFDSADLRPEAKQALHDVAEIIRQYPGASIRVESHTDAKGSSSYNRKLSERRAESVRHWLMANEGLHDADFKIAGLGESQPAAANVTPDGSDNPQGRQKNRRVEIVVEKP
jgi:outer membrane protein OmpA-like peptidoglycan-associated protein